MYAGHPSLCGDVFMTISIRSHLRNEFNFRNVHGAMNTSGLLQELHVNFARDPKYSWFHEQTKNWIYCLYLYFYCKCLNYKIIYNLGNKTVLYLICNRINCHTVCRSVKQKNGTDSMNTTANGANKGFVLHVWLGVAHCQSQHQCYFWRICSMFEAYCTGK